MKPKKYEIIYMLNDKFGSATEFTLANAELRTCLLLKEGAIDVQIKVLKLKKLLLSDLN